MLMSQYLSFKFEPASIVIMTCRIVTYRKVSGLTKLTNLLAYHAKIFNSSSIMCILFLPTSALAHYISSVIYTCILFIMDSQLLLIFFPYVTFNYLRHMFSKIIGINIWILLSLSVHALEGYSCHLSCRLVLNLVKYQIKVQTF